MAQHAATKFTTILLRRDIADLLNAQLYLKPHLRFSINGKRRIKIMNIRFSPDTHKLLIARANREDKPAAALVNELITAILQPEEKNEKIGRQPK
ncbi:TPA: hypothetical protein MIN53_02890 [Klebsiella pneumoniae]|nr:hypothetical protein CWN46_18965 [Klebsiella pneumoniae]PXK93972.1 hypothetical protein DMS44_15375 [Klebsiella variicola]PZX90298.1 hypothetical protein DMR06_06430 [Klebsiella pneumoniae]HBX9986389.1 hypothetical protein [Klebsiella variicola]HBY0087574.1 hypothetical protein [Klebsiella pneumoniae]